MPRRHKGGARGRRVRRALVMLTAALACLAMAAGAFAIAAVHATVQAGKARMQDVGEEIVVDDTIEFEGVAYRPKDKVVSIAILGFDRTGLELDGGAAGQADAIMVLALDTETGAMDVIAVPRDSMVPVDRYAGEANLGQETLQISLAFSYGDGYHTSCERTVDAIERMLGGQPISYYFAMDMGGISDINDSVGGVTLSALDTIPWTDIVAGQDITLLGRDAYHYLHYRDIAVTDSPLRRQARQEQYLKAFASKVLGTASGADIGTLVSLYQTAAPYTVTNLGLEEFSYLATVVAGGEARSLETTTFEGTYISNGTFAEFYPDEASIKRALVDVYYEPAA